MEDSFRVFVVDDDVLILEVLHSALSDDYKVEVYASAEECLERMAQVRPDVLLLDVNMPEVDGLSMCRRLKDDWELQDIPVIFMSASDDIEARLACYGVGGEDFILKPIDPDVLHRKIRVAQRILAQKQALQEQAGYAQRTALSAMTSMSELGVVLQFLSKSFTCSSLREIGDAVLESLRQYDLQGAVQLRVGGVEISVSEHGVDLPLEVAVLNHVRNSGRIFQFKSRCVFNYGRITVLVNNMPLEDAERCGRIRDNGAILAEGADARLHAIELEQAMLARRRGVEEALPMVHDAVDAVQAGYRRNCFNLTQNMIEFQETLIKSYVHLGLTESQEQYMTTLANGFMERMVGTQDESLTIVGQLEEVANTLEKLVSD